MLFYFSATGNNKYIAERIGEALDDRIVSITECVRSAAYDFTLSENESLGFVTPTYFWGLPSIVVDFIEKLTLSLSGEHYIYHVLSFGTTTGNAQKDMEKLLQGKGLSLQGRFAVCMVDTWTPMFDLSDAEKNRKDTENAEPQIDEAISGIKARAVGDFNRHKGPAFLSGMLRREYESKRATKFFTVKDSCVGCGLCAANCPVDAIQIKDKKPTWIKEKCTLCLACLHRCPRFAIQYAGKTEKHGQFVNPNTKL